MRGRGDNQKSLESNPKGNLNENDRLEGFHAHLNKNQFRRNGSNNNPNNSHRGQQSTLSGGFKNEYKVHEGREWKDCF